MEENNYIVNITFLIHPIALPIVDLVKITSLIGYGSGPVGSFILQMGKF
jgi:hypothetical protein